jgi:hypothetical protein
MLVFVRAGEHVGEVSSREFEALTLDQSPPTPDSTHRYDQYMLVLLLSFSLMAVDSSF